MILQLMTQGKEEKNEFYQQEWLLPLNNSRLVGAKASFELGS